MMNTVRIGTDDVILGGNGALVSSASVPGGWHVVKDGTCDCLGYQYRGRCRHVAAVAEARTLPSPATSPVFDLATLTLARPR